MTDKEPAKQGRFPNIFTEMLVNGVVLLGLGLLGLWIWEKWF